MKYLQNKVPGITLVFWMIKVMATTVGETGADYLSETLRLGLVGTSYVMAGLLLILLIIQLKVRKYVPAIYWAVVVFISVVGTLISDNLVDNLGISLVTTTLLFASALAVIFASWYISEKTLSVHTIITTRREIFYWAAILFTFALGTSAGDLLSETTGLGYARATMIFAAGIGLTAIAYYLLKLNGILSFWIVYILTRPLGASLGDLLTQPPKEGGLGIGTTQINIVFLLLIILLVVYLTKKENKTRLESTG